MTYQLHEIGVYTLPQWSAVFFEYGDIDALEPEDVELCQQFLESLDKEGYKFITFDWSGESFFSHFPEFGLPCECIEVRVFGKINTQ